MTKVLSAVLFIMGSMTAWACPGCHDPVNSNQPQYTFIILGIFIAITYIPFYLLYRATQKYDPKKFDGIQ